jgi:hypothetical protein
MRKPGCLGASNDIFRRAGKFDSTYTTPISESFRITATSGTTGTRSPRRKIGKIDENDCHNGALRPAYWRIPVPGRPRRRPKSDDARRDPVFRDRQCFTDSGSARHFSRFPCFLCDSRRRWDAAQPLPTTRTANGRADSDSRWSCAYDAPAECDGPARSAGRTACRPAQWI